MPTKKKSGPVLSATNLAQIRSGEIEFGDFTLVVGAQASGKSIFLQLLKLLVDRQQIFDTLQLNGFDWGGRLDRLLDMYFGESMSGIWKPDTAVSFDKKVFSSENLLNRKGVKDSSREETIFYIPAQRVVTMSQGWPRAFNSFDIGDPYVLKSFSETLRVLMEKEFSNGDSGNIFPRSGKMSEALRKQIDSSIFNGASIELDKTALRRRFLMRIEGQSLPFMTWSAGQKEFMPLLLSLFHLLPSGKQQKRDTIDWVVLEEPEMGLHPRAIQTVMLLALQLLQRGYRVVMSTHSPVLLELIWVINNLQQHGGSVNDLFQLFALPKSPSVREIFETAIQEKTFHTYFFDRQNGGVTIRNISSLDAGNDDPAVANWGGLSEFAGRAVEIVSQLPQ